MDILWLQEKFPSLLLGLTKLGCRTKLPSGERQKSWFFFSHHGTVFKVIRLKFLKLDFEPHAEWVFSSDKNLWWPVLYFFNAEACEVKLSLHSTYTTSSTTRNTCSLVLLQAYFFSKTNLPPDMTGTYLLCTLFWFGRSCVVPIVILLAKSGDKRKINKNALPPKKPVFWRVN